MTRPNCKMMYMSKISRIFTGTAIAALLVCGCEKESGSAGMTDADVITIFEVDTESNLKNPYTGWTLYCPFADMPRAYWAKVSEVAEKYAGTLYIRWTWADMEPEEGRYAWDMNEKFIQFVEGARERGLRLCFRVYVDSYAQGKNATPQWVLDHARSYEPNGSNGGYLTPYGDDPYFLEKYTKFIEAFGKKFNDPALVDYVDSYGLGFSGEENNIRWYNQDNALDAFSTIVRAYEKAFDKVINVVNYGKSTEEAAIVYDELGFSTRRDGFCSHWFPESDQIAFSGLFPDQMLVGEACYSSDYDFATAENGKWGTWENYSRDLVEMALNTHVNYLDLRDAATALKWLELNPEGVRRFLAQGGYRIYPAEVRYKTEGDKVIVQHSWHNYGTGVLPNNNRHLNYKYRIALGLFDSSGELVSRTLSDGIEVSSLVNGAQLQATDEISLNALAPGSYRLGIAIVNTLENDSKDITLAVKDATKITGEYVYAGDIEI